jgi:hypothetical protein
MSECTCDARFSGNDEAEWLARGAPSCICERVEGWHDIVAEVCFDYEWLHKPCLGNTGETDYLTVYKTTFFADGKYERKGNYGKWDQKLWPRLIALVELMVGEKLQ